MVKFGRVVFALCERAERQTNKQTDMLITVLCTPPGGEVTSVCIGPPTEGWKRTLAALGIHGPLCQH